MARRSFRGRWDAPPLQPLSTPPISHPSLGQSCGSLGETGPPASTPETQRVSPIPRVVFVRPIVGRLEDLTTARLTTFHHSADTFALNNEDGFSLAAPQVEPPLPYLQSSIDRKVRKGYSPMGSVPGISGTSIGSEPGPPCSYNGRKGSKQNYLEPKTLLKTQTRWDGKDPTPRSHQRTELNPPRWVTKPGPPFTVSI